MDNLYFSHMFGWGLGGGLMMILFWAVIILFIVWIVKEVGRNDSGKTSSKSALDILKERYANGEIDKTEFEEKKRDLGN